MVKTFTFGPMIGLPSTEWVGVDIARYIDSNYPEVNIRYFSNFNESIDADTDTIFIIKIMPPLQWIIQLKKKGIKILYFPVDFFHHEKLFLKSKSQLAAFDSILLHNKRIIQHLPKGSAPTNFVDHYLKYNIERKRDYIDKGFLLWIGHLEYLPSLFEKLNQSTFKYPIRILADLENFQNKKSFLQRKFKDSGLSFNVIKKKFYVLINGIKVEQWSKEKQEEYLATCKAAFDTKDNKLAHDLKPPTKSQKYIFNLIPLALDEHMYAVDYFRDKGLAIPSLEQSDYWLSFDYYCKIEQFVTENLYTQSIGYISQEYIKIEELVENRQLLKIFSLQVKHSANIFLYYLFRIFESIKSKFEIRKRL